MTKAKRFMNGGFATPNTYPFANQNIPAADSSVKIGARQEPLGNVMDNQPSVTMYKRGGKVKKFETGGKAEYAIPDARARAAMEKVKEDKEREKMGTAYERSLTTTAPAPAASVPAKPPVKKAAGGCAKAYAGGGSVRGSGCEQRGKTKGRMV